MQLGQGDKLKFSVFDQAVCGGWASHGEKRGRPGKSIPQAHPRAQVAENCLVTGLWSMRGVLQERVHGLHLGSKRTCGQIESAPCLCAWWMRLE